MKIEDKDHFSEITTIDNEIRLEKIYSVSTGDTSITIKEYYSNGRIKSLINVTGTARDSSITHYFANGSTAANYNTFNGRPIGKQVEYYSNGNVKKIVLSTWKHTDYFEMKCSKKAEVISIDGDPVYLNINKMPLHVGETFILDLMVINEKEFKTHLRLRLQNPNSKIVLDTIPRFQKYKNNNHSYMLAGKFINEGNYKFIVDFTFQQGDKIILNKTYVDSIDVVQSLQ